MTGRSDELSHSRQCLTQSAVTRVVADRVLPSCCSRVTAPVELHPDTIIKIGRRQYRCDSGIVVLIITSKPRAGVCRFPRGASSVLDPECISTLC